jgi:hypothetical protein
MGLQLSDVDVGRQLVVEAAPERFWGQTGIQLEMRDLGERMDAGIGSARAVELELPASRDLADGAIDLALHRAGVLLDLPAAVLRAGILDDELEARHQALALREPGSLNPLST